MSKEEFKPLHYLHNMQTESEQETTQHRETEKDMKDPCEELQSKCQEEREKLEEEIKSLRSQLESLDRERAKLLEERETLLRDLDEKRAVEKLIETLSERLMETFKEVKTDIREEVIELTLGLVKRLILTDLMPKEDLVLRVLSKVLESGVELKGQVVIYLSPKDFQRISPYLEDLKQRLGDGVQLSLTVKEELKEGELLIETPKLWLERRYEDIIADLLEDLKNGGTI
ncbi:FliH/SctL family protein [Hydrogenobacter sp. T-2]|uniref:FliH/SctL family protein n=1 Tax=Pampinifervens diazotrophicum TaxID=1632018 RepID=UPI002B25C54E|nr:FliH/SctL family protein [Hydrogenobacter sp. T-2]WPM33028.1 FliH/SctL family protein [Hydrogenobacter sp. T-2]